MTSNDINDIHNSMIMSKLSDAPSAVALRDERGDIKAKYVIVKGAPFEYRTFMFMVTAMLRHEPHHVYAEHITDAISELWQTVGFKFDTQESPIKPPAKRIFGGWRPNPTLDVPDSNKITNFARGVITETAMSFSGESDDPYVRSVDYRPFMEVVYQLLQDC